jgi:hypothetical protein
MERARHFTKHKHTVTPHPSPLLLLQQKDYPYPPSMATSKTGSASTWSRTEIGCAQALERVTPLAVVQEHNGCYSVQTGYGTHPAMGLAGSFRGDKAARQ